MHRVSRITGHLTTGTAPSFNKSILHIAPEVAAALQAHKPVVALESTIISHGMPYPQNVETALEVERICRENGALPATIAILDGVIKVGLNKEELYKLGKLGHTCRKVSRRDMAIVLAEKGNGATTVAGTMYVANMAGIKMFVTGGIGGVHRGAETTMDISADLTELGRTPVTVICAGVKSILDIPKTIEYLETQGVTVGAYGQEEFPAFFTPHSGQKAQVCVRNADEGARLVDANMQLGMKSSIVIGVPVPESEAAKAGLVQKATDDALAEAASKGIKGYRVTPFLLQRVNELTGGDSLRSNICLIKNNVAVGAQIAARLSEIQRQRLRSEWTRRAASGHTVLFGGANVDMVGKPIKGGSLLQDTSNPGVLHHHWGGVARNMAECLARLQLNPVLVTAVGDDANGKHMLEACHDVGVNVEHCHVSTTKPTSSYLAVHNETGALVTTIADMAICDQIVPAVLPCDKLLADAPLVVLDANLPQETIDHVSTQCAQRHIPVWFEPTGVTKSVRGLDAIRNGAITFVSPSVNELFWLTEALQATGKPQSEYKNVLDSNVQAIKERIKVLISHGVRHVIVTRGAKGVVVASASDRSKEGMDVFVMPAVDVPEIVNTTGAGDTLAAAVIWALCTIPDVDFPSAAQYGMLAASMTLQSSEPVNPAITNLLLHRLHRKHFS